MLDVFLVNHHLVVEVSSRNGRERVLLFGPFLGGPWTVLLHCLLLEQKPIDVLGRCVAEVKRIVCVAND